MVDNTTPSSFGLPSEDRKIEASAEYQDIEDSFEEIEAVLADIFVDNRTPLPEEEESMDYGVGDCS